tara:strand:- start:405 stop:608 length:204 start_codon:yes stop_codon:yes gene_type:complete
MKRGDLVKFIGTWGDSVTPGERQTGIVMEVWTNGRTRMQQSADILWDNGYFSIHFSTNNVEVINESR